MTGQVHKKAPRAWQTVAAAVVTTVACFVANLPVGAAAGWSVTPSPNGMFPQGSQYAISCPAATECIAVGSHPNTIDGNGLPLAEIWNGTTWSAQSTPLPSAGVEGFLTGIACWTTAGCIAVGGFGDGTHPGMPLAETWNGTTWTPESPSPVAGSTGSWMSGIACPTATRCIGVGYDNQVTGSQFGFAETWDGTTWTPQPAAVPRSALSAGLAGVACPSINFCMAVGSQYDGTQDLALAESWDGATWTVRTGTDTHQPNTRLSAVACPSDTACTAVGAMGLGSNRGLTLAERWDGTSWSVQGSPNPAIVDSLLGVDCPSTTMCIAVGAGTNTTVTSTLVETWDGTVWRVKSSPSPAGSLASQLNGVSCQSTADCTSVGSSTFQFFFSVEGATSQNYFLADKTLAERWTGAGWKIQKTPNPKGLSPNALAAVSCASATSCTAVGYSVGAGQAPLAQRWTGTKWTIQHMPNVAGATRTLLAGVACPTSSECVAVGYSYVGTISSSLVEQWNGTSWGIVASPSPTGAASSLLTSVSCTSSTECMAVGAFRSPAGPLAPFADRWDGTSWTLESVPVVGTATDSSLNGIACVSSTMCTAVGYFHDPSTGDQPLAESWDGTAWTIGSLPGPVGSADSLAGVSCWQARQFPFATSCMAVGQYFDSVGQRPLTELWNGTSWSIEPAPGTGNLAAVSCAQVAFPSSISCIAVGLTSPNTLAEQWNGSAWAVQTTPNRSADTDTAELSGVACTSTKACVAVGDSLLNGRRLRRTLVVSYSG